MVRVMIGGACGRRRRRSIVFQTWFIAPMRRPVRPPRDARILLLDLAQADELLGLKQPAFIISISAVPPAIGRIVGSVGLSSLIASDKRCRFGEFEGDHLSSAGFSANAARSRVANCFSMVLGLGAQHRLADAAELAGERDSTE
jgi:hypothetical protein